MSEIEKRIWSVYELFRNKEKIFIGVTDDIQSALNRATSCGIIFDHMNISPRKTGSKTALRRLEDKLRRYQYGHKGELPIHNMNPGNKAG